MKNKMMKLILLMHFINTQIRMLTSQLTKIYNLNRTFKINLIKVKIKVFKLFKRMIKKINIKLFKKMKIKEKTKMKIPILSKN